MEWIKMIIQWINKTTSGIASSTTENDCSYLYFGVAEDLDNVTTTQREEGISA